MTYSAETDPDLARLWPPFALRVTAGPLELRVVTDADLPEVVRLVEAGLHDPAQMPFAMPWTDAPADQLGSNTVAFHWLNRAQFSPPSWSLDLVVRHEGNIVGMQGFNTRNYLVTRTGETGSWLGRAYQGRGIGTAMRRAICALLFDELGALEITSAAYTDNPASLAVSRKVGYLDNGLVREQRRPGELAVSQKLVLTPATFRRDAVEVQVHGVAPLRRFIGLDPAS